MLDRIGEEVARATSIVRYAPHSRFSPQSWLRLPPGDMASCMVGGDGCTVWVKSGHLARAQSVPSAAR